MKHCKDGNKAWEIKLCNQMYCMSYNHVIICLGTHDFQNISVTSPRPGVIQVTSDFLNESTATGILGVIHSTPEIVYHLIKRERYALHVADTIGGVGGGDHSVSVFVVEENGLPFNRTASIPKHVTVENSRLI